MCICVSVRVSLCVCMCAYITFREYGSSYLLIAIAHPVRNTILFGTVMKYYVMQQHLRVGQENDREHFHQKKDILYICIC